MSKYLLIRGVHRDSYIFPPFSNTFSGGRWTIKKKKKELKNLLQRSVHLSSRLTRQSVEHQVRCNKRCQSESKYKLRGTIYQRSYTRVSISGVFNGDKCDLCETRRCPGRGEKKNALERFERMRLEIKKKIERENEKKNQRVGGYVSRDVDASFIPDAIVRFSLVVLCHHSSRLTICPRIRFLPLLSRSISSVHRFSLVHGPKKPSLAQYFRTDR